MRKSLIIFFIFSFYHTIAQELDTVYLGSSSSQLVDPIEIEPEYPGGKDVLKKYLNENGIRLSTSDNTKDYAYVLFDIRKDGSIRNIEVIRGLNQQCDSLILSAVENMPNWIPGKMGSAKSNDWIPIGFRMGLPIECD